MADSGIKKSRFLEAFLPAINSEFQGYIVKYRVISEDKNRTSHWSPTFLIKPEYTYESGSINHSKSNSISLIAWDAVNILKNNKLIRKAHEYDIWLKWDRDDGGDWIYSERIDGTNISMLIPSTYKINGVVQSNSPNKLSVEVFLKGTPISRDATFLRVYQGGPWTV